MSMLAGFQTALSGMKVAQSQLDLVSRNIANVDTAGYTRKTAQQNTIVLAGYNSGVSMGNIERTVNEGLLKSYLTSNSTYGGVSVKSEYLSQMQTQLGTPEGQNSIAANVSDLQSAFNSFAQEVNSASSRYNLLTNAQTMTNRLNSLSQSIQQLRGNADLQISADVDSINSILDTIDDLNDRIVKYTVLGQDGVADLEDQRDQSIRELSQYIDVTYFKRENGEMVIQTTKGIMLLDKDPHYLSHTAVTQANPTTGYADGAITGIFVDGTDITEKISGGELQGLIEVRDDTLSSLQSQLDELAGVLMNGINQAHNRGTAYPNTPSELSGSRTFIDPANQHVKIENGDVRFIIFEGNGKQVSTASLIGDMGFNANGDTVDNMVSTINDWLTSADGANLPQAYASVTNDGNIVINTGDTTYSVSIVDEANSTKGSTQQDVVIKFDANGDNVYDRTFEGFSNFCGLNDFFSTNQNESVYDSKVLSLNANLGIREKITLDFGSSENPDMGSLTIYPADNLQDIVDKINADPNLNEYLRASLVPNGNGYMLRIDNMSGGQLEISEQPGATGTTSGFIERIGLEPSYVGLSGSISVREDIQITPGLIAGGSPEYDTSAGIYRLNAAANNIANDMGKVFINNQSFGQAGSIASTSTTLANYASTFVGNIASGISDADNTLSYQQELLSSITTKEAQISGVDIDEELSQLIIYQKSYAACAQTFTASKEMLDILLGMMS